MIETLVEQFANNPLCANTISIDASVAELPGELKGVVETFARHESQLVVASGPAREKERLIQQTTPSGHGVAGAAISESRVQEAFPVPICGGPLYGFEVS